ncbi:MAG: hypothetical protein PHO86_05175 [Bacilli bacterium]|nr:hypothetical protein [Bacilli bacterium]
MYKDRDEQLELTKKKQKALLKILPFIISGCFLGIASAVIDIINVFKDVDINSLKWISFSLGILAFLSFLTGLILCVTFYKNILKKYK